MEEVKILKILRKPKERGYQVTLPKEAAEALAIKGGERVRVLLDRKKKRIIYEPL
jgi:bifunctional DNA-binding transcriptional regulator/antitoxin component of YhaV-PrlF toxin-antitoxin module